MSTQKPEVLRGGVVENADDAELALFGAVVGAAEFVDVGTDFASVAAEMRDGQEAARGRVP
jgi:hypothetical protein